MPGKNKWEARIDKSYTEGLGHLKMVYFRTEKGDYEPLQAETPEKVAEMLKKNKGNLFEDYDEGFGGKEEISEREKIYICQEFEFDK